MELMMQLIENDPSLFYCGIIVTAVLVATFMLEKFFPNAKGFCDMVELILAVCLWLLMVMCLDVPTPIFWWMVLLTAFVVFLAFDAGRSVGSRQDEETGNE